MQRLIAWFADNGVAANLLMLFLVAAGLMTLPRLKLEVFPELSSDLISVSVPYPGAAPEEVEEGIVVRIEEAIQGLDGIQELRSTSAENNGTVQVEVEPGADLDRLLNDIKARVDAIDTFPEEAEEPIIQEVLIRRQVITVAVSGDAPEATLKRLGEQVRDDISALPGVSQVQLQAARPYEISIEVSERALTAHGLTFDQVAQAVRRAALDLPGGSLETRGGEILLRTEGQVYRGGEFSRLPLLTLPDGSRLAMGDVATVVDGFADTDQAARFDGQPAVLVQVFRVGEQNAPDVADKVERYVAEARPRMPDGIQLTTWQDDSKILESRLELLLRNGRAGFVLVFLILALFLRLTLAGWVAVGIPISFLGTVLAMPLLGVSVNLISLFAFIVVLGIVVDDAIVVGENVYSHYQSGKQGTEAAVAGASEVGVPVVFAVLTTVVAFVPLLFVPGNTGKIMRQIPLIVIPTLLVSLTESLLVLPHHLSHLAHGPKKAPSAPRRLWRKLREGFAGQLSRVVERVYRPSLDRALAGRYVTAAAALACLLLTGALVAGGYLQFTFFPPVEADNVAAILEMPPGTPVSVTSAAIARLEQEALVLKEEVEAGGAPVFRHLLASVGEQPFRTAQTQGGGNVGDTFAGSHLGEVNIELVPAEERQVTSEEIARRWRERVGAIPGATGLVFTSSLFTTGEAINVQLSGPRLEELKTVAQRLKEELAGYPGVRDITDSFRAGKEELSLAITPEAQAAGLTLFDLGRQVRQAFFGEEAQRIQRGRDEIKVMVRYPELERRSLGDLEQLRIRTPDGLSIPFATAATATRTRGPSAIRRVDRQRVINVTADVDLEKANANEVIADLTRRVLPPILAEHPQVRYQLAGQQQEQQETLGGLLRGFLLALLGIYTLLAIPFRSYFQPLIVMSAIPFGLVGAALGHLLLGLDLTVLSMFGIVALTGIVVNDSLVMIDFVNRGYRDGTPLFAAIREAGAARFRPILLTTLTTFAGLTPLLLERSVQAQFLIPMAVSLAFGVLFATAITLILVPVGYVILEDLKGLLRKWLGRGEGDADLEAARKGAGG
jgi:multidrug efflux pump subunit AcrB